MTKYIPCPTCRYRNALIYCETCSGSGMVKRSYRDKLLWTGLALLFLAGMLFLFMGMK